jgi:hypothetical protein
MDDPLVKLPPEIVSRVLEFAPTATLASLTRTSRAWHHFIDDVHQEAIYSSPSKTDAPPCSKDFSFLRNQTSFSKYFEYTTSWKDLCKRQLLLARNWEAERPTTRQSVIQVGNDPVWRFRADFKRRFFVSTSQAGGLYVTDMDSGQLLWRLPSNLHSSAENAVRPYAHLEYQDGTAVWDRDGDILEVWKTDMDGTASGEFRRVAMLDHECQTRGFQLSYDTLCVVSTEGKGFVYDFTQTPPKLRTEMNIENDAVGHLDQNEEVVMFSMGSRGYHFFDKASGKPLGILEPWHCETVETIHHIRPPELRRAPQELNRHGPSVRVFPPESPRTDRLDPIQISWGPHDNPEVPALQEDEWGAGMLSGSLMAGVSRGGRLFVCTDWKKALRSQQAMRDSSYLIECDSADTHFDLGGWLSIKNNRIMFEILNRVYVVALDENGRVPEDDDEMKRPSYSFFTSSAPRLAVPVSFMALFDDCIAHTFTVLTSTPFEIAATLANICVTDTRLAQLAPHQR